jgi:hypothetical protein
MLNVNYSFGNMFYARLLSTLNRSNSELLRIPYGLPHLGICGLTVICTYPFVLTFFALALILALSSPVCYRTSQLIVAFVGSLNRFPNFSFPLFLLIV